MKKLALTVLALEDDANLMVQIITMFTWLIDFFSDRLVSASEILDQVTSKDIYDRRLRPNYGGEPVDVAVTLHVTKISSISELDMDYTLDFDIKQMWKDPRLAWKHDIFNKSIRVQGSSEF
uniref:Neurotransmitter-gated ion-channel ligand-binding domain-containing protein n=1 Tax=Romanomermis culicivorax TaxID=13658 RepID=A0A915JIB5_ROMCU